MTLEITTLYTVPLVVLMFILWLQVVKTRGTLGVSIGYNGDTALHEKIRRHGNFIEYVPMALIVMTLAELRGADAMVLHISGILLVVSRAVHPIGLRHDKPMHVARLIGNSGSLLAIFIATGAILWSHI